MTTKRTPKGHLTPDYIAAYMKKLAWLDTQPKPKVSISEKFEPPRRTVSGFHNRLTSS